MNSRLAVSRLRAIRRAQTARRQERRQAYWAYRASLPHDPAWNLIPRRADVPYECSWHGMTVTGGCPECVREHAEYRETGTWEDRRHGHG